MYAFLGIKSLGYKHATKRSIPFDSWLATARRRQHASHVGDHERWQSSQAHTELSCGYVADSSEYADWQDAKYCLACASGGYALQVAMRASGLKPGDKVLANAYTLAPVPGGVEATLAVARLGQGV